jgi:hypothetical protein
MKKSIFVTLKTKCVSDSLMFQSMYNKTNRNEFHIQQINSIMSGSLHYRISVPGIRGFNFNEGSIGALRANNAIAKVQKFIAPLLFEYMPELIMETIEEYTADSKSKEIIRLANEDASTIAEKLELVNRYRKPENFVSVVRDTEYVQYEVTFRDGSTTRVVMTSRERSAATRTTWFKLYGVCIGGEGYVFPNSL